MPCETRQNRSKRRLSLKLPLHLHPLVHSRHELLPPINLLLDKVLDGALVGLSHGLLLDGPAAIIETFGLVHGLLQRVALPPEHVVGVRAGPIALKGPDERVAVLGGVPQAGEFLRVPGDFKGYLWDAHGVGGRAGGCVVEVLGVDRVVHVRLVVGRIEGLAIPAAVGSCKCNAFRIKAGDAYGGKWCVVKIPPVHFCLGKSETRAPRLPPVMHW